MENKRGICTKCGLAHSEDPDVHAASCTDDNIRLMEIDRECGPRAVREFMLASGFKGHVKEGKTLGVIEEAEVEAATIRVRKQGA